MRIGRFSIDYFRQRTIGQRRDLDHVGGVLLPLMEFHGRTTIERKAIWLGPTFD